MKLFLDTANLDEIRDALSWGVIAGVTTNPTLVAREGKVDFHQHVRRIAELVDGPVSAEALSTEADDIVREARQLAALAPNVVVKIPLMPEGLKATKVLAAEGVKTNLTLVFSACQGLLAARAGATYVSPFVGRLDDAGNDGMEVVRQLAEIFRLHAIPTQIICASVRHPMHVLQAAKAGAHIATVPYQVLKKMVSHPLTEAGIRRFLEDWRRVRE